MLSLFWTPCIFRPVAGDPTTLVECYFDVVVLHSLAMSVCLASLCGAMRLLAIRAPFRFPQPAASTPYHHLAHLYAYLHIVQVIHSAVAK